MRDALLPLDIAAAPGSPSFSPDSSAALGPPSPTVSMAESVRPKKVNPFVDLIETEKFFVDTLSGIIRVRVSIITIVAIYHIRPHSPSYAESGIGVVSIELTTS